MATTKQVPHLNDDRRCWLAVRDQLNKKANELGPFGWLTSLAGGGAGRRARGGTGEVPDWFLGDVERRAAAAAEKQC